MQVYVECDMHLQGWAGMHQSMSQDSWREVQLSKMIWYPSNSYIQRAN